MDTFLSQINVLLADNSPEAAVKIREIQAILDRKVQVLGGMVRLLAELACNGYVNPNITDANFPGMDPNVSIEGVRPVKIGKNFTRESAIAVLKAMNPPMKPAALDKSIRWCAANPDYQRSHWMVCLAQSWFDSGRDECVVYFYGLSLDRRVRLSHVAGKWDAAHEVFAEQELALVPSVPPVGTRSLGHLELQTRCFECPHCGEGVIIQMKK